MAASAEAIAELRRRIYELLDVMAERISMSFAVYEVGSEWPTLYRDAGANTLCGFARKANPTSGRCRDDEAQMARQALAEGRCLQDYCWQGNMRRVISVSMAGDPVLAVALCGFGVDPVASANDYLPGEIASALGLEGPRPDRSRAFPGDSLLPPSGADVIIDLLAMLFAAIAREVEASFS